MNYNYVKIVTELNDELYIIDSPLQYYYAVGFSYMHDGYADEIYFGGISIWDSSRSDDIDDVLDKESGCYLEEDDFKEMVLTRARNITRRCGQTLDSLVEKKRR